MPSVCAPRRHVINTDKTIFEPALTIMSRSLSFAAISLDIATERESGVPIIVRAWHLPVTESLRSRHHKAVDMSDIQKFDLREWLVAPILLPVMFGLVLAGAVIFQW
jgi:hypothetical protein